MMNFILQFATLVNKNWFIMLSFFPLIMIYKMGLFLHPIFTLSFILLGILLFLVSLSILTHPKEKTQTSNKRTIGKKLLITFTALVFISINLFAGWISYKTAQKESVRFDNLHLLAQFFFIFSNFILTVSLFIGIVYRKLPEKDA